MLNSFTYSLSETVDTAVQSILEEWEMKNKINRVWNKDAGVWTNDDEAKWLGWLDVVEKELEKTDEYAEFKGILVRAG